MVLREESLELWFPGLLDNPVPKALEERGDVGNLATLDVRVRSSSATQSPHKNLTHDADLSNLWDYYELQIARGRIRRDKIAARECNQRCKHITFTYPASLIYRHPKQLAFGFRLMELDYRYCKTCFTLMPKSMILDLEAIRESKRDPSKRRTTPRTELMPIKCPCCASKTAHVSVLIRKTKMGKILFSLEGY